MAFELINHGVARSADECGFVFLCDHASNALPEPYGTLGLEAGQLERHIGWDIGAGDVVRHLAQAFAAPAVLAKYSRLLIDLNREAIDPTLIMQISDGAIIAGNRHVDSAERDVRISQYYEPYHGVVKGQIDSVLARGQVPVLVSVHSFTPSWKGVGRPWHIGLLWDRDDRVVRPLEEILCARGDLVVGNNEPYSGALMGDCLYTHGTSRGLPHILIEIRQDLIGDVASVTKWAKVVEDSLRALQGVPGAREHIWQLASRGGLR